jgi:long-subunit acyl-CoA synthetase (AMP-forming)
MDTQPHVVICTPVQLKSLIAEVEHLPAVAKSSPSSRELAVQGGRAAALGQRKPRFYGWNRRQVFSNIWGAAGLARCKFLGCYGDTCSQRLVERFMSIGLCLCNVYGCNEATGIIAATRNDPIRPHLPLAHEWKFGRVGRCIPGCEVRFVGNSEDPDKLLFLGRNTFMGYLNRQTISTADGFIDTGDLGSVDETSLIEIQGRSCDRIVLSTGMSLQVSSVESAIEQSLPCIARAVLFGHRLPHVSVLFELMHSDSKSGALSDACIAWQREKLVSPVEVTASGALKNDSFMRQIAVSLHVSAAAAVIMLWPSLCCGCRCKCSSHKLRICR